MTASSGPDAAALAGDDPAVHFYSAAVSIPIAPGAGFAIVDDPARLAGHMTQPSWAMLGARMSVRTDEGYGRRSGSRIHLEGRLLGFVMRVEEVVDRYDPPVAKGWRTVEGTRIPALEGYRVDVEVLPLDSGSSIRIALRYRLGRRIRWLWRPIAEAYARWCVQRMLRDVAAAACAVDRGGRRR